MVIECSTLSSPYGGQGALAKAPSRWEGEMTHAFICMSSFKITPRSNGL